MNRSFCLEAPTLQRSPLVVTWRWTLSCLKWLIGLIAMYYFVAAPPLHLYFAVLPHAGPSSVYVPGKYHENKQNKVLGDDMTDRIGNLK